MVSDLPFLLLPLQCEERYQTLAFDMSSQGWKSLFAQNGIFRREPACPT